MTFGVVDANVGVGGGLAVSSIVPVWLRHEIKQAGKSLVPCEAADVVFLCFAGSIGWRAAIRRCSGSVNKRALRIAGGHVAAVPFATVGLADAIVVGEGFATVRAVLQCASVSEARALLAASPHVLMTERLAALARDGVHLRGPAPILAVPDTEVQWDMPPIRSDDHVTRLIASKGCKRKCGFCATSYMQPYQIHERPDRMLLTINALAARGHRVQLVTNDPAALPWYAQIKVRLDSQSFTIYEMRDPVNRAAIGKAQTGMARFGVEGISERIRAAFGKPISNDEVVEIVSDMAGRRVPCHLFFIIGAPYETAEDWDEFKTLYRRLAAAASFGIVRVKLTAFLPTPPAPLARFMSARYDSHVADFKRWVANNAASRHMMCVFPRNEATNLRDIAEQWGVACVTRDIQDVAPSIEAQHRLPWEVVEWPLTPAKRWTIAEAYRRRLHGAPTA